MVLFRQGRGYSGKRKMLPVKRDNREVETERVTYSMHMGVVSMGRGAGSSTHAKNDLVTTQLSYAC